jgi:hypothetical protein
MCETWQAADESSNLFYYQSQQLSVHAEASPGANASASFDVPRSKSNTIALTHSSWAGQALAAAAIILRPAGLVKYDTPTSTNNTSGIAHTSPTKYAEMVAMTSANVTPA